MWPSLSGYCGPIALRHEPRAALTTVRAARVTSRNSLYFFVFLGLYRAVKLRNRETIFILSFSIIYIVILAISGISFQDRFQILSLPFLIVFMSDGIIADHKRKKQQWILYLGFIFLAIFMWNVFKLSNRGLL